jgi:hypothetical protein
VLEDFGRVIAPGGAGIVIASMAGHMFPPFASEQEHALAHAPTDELLALPFLNPEGMGGAAYGYAKRGNHLRVEAESLGPPGTSARPTRSRRPPPSCSAPRPASSPAATCSWTAA